MSITAITGTTLSSSSQFSNLPAELRSQIWREVLPAHLEPTLFSYKKGCWQPRFISESDEDHDPENFYGIIMTYDHELHNPVEIQSPLFFVNREARGIVQAWMDELGISTRFHKSDPQPVFIRRFDPLRDALYVSCDKYDEFYSEPALRGFEPDMIGQNFGSAGRVLPNIAIPVELFWTIRATIDELLDWICPAVLYIVINAQADLNSRDNNGKQLQWKFQDTQGRALVWKLGDRRFGWEEGEYVCDQDMYNRIEDVANRDIVGKLVSDSWSSFEIRPVWIFRS